MDVRKIDWDTPLKNTASSLFSPRRTMRNQPKMGCIITARYHGADVRMRVVERDGDKSSIAEVIGVDDKNVIEDVRSQLCEGDTVVVPDSKRAVVRYC